MTTSNVIESKNNPVLGMEMLASEITFIANDIKSMQLFFITRQQKKGQYEYNTYYPILGKNLNQEIVDLIFNPFVNQIKGSSLGVYDPLIHNEDEIEYLHRDEVKESSKMLDKINELHEAQTFSLSDIDNRLLLGYCIKCVSKDNKIMYCFKKLTNTKLLEKKKILWGLTTTSTIEKITNQPLVIDEKVDCILYNDIFYINNNYSFEMLFSINEEYRRKINYILSEITKKDIIINIEAFSTGCKNTKAAQRRLIRIASSQYSAIDIYKKDPEKMVNLIKDHPELALEVSADNKIVYNENDDVEPILRLIDGGLITRDVYGTKGHALKFSKTLE